VVLTSAVVAIPAAEVATSAAVTPAEVDMVVAVTAADITGKRNQE
jgi:hypothetical protein